MNQKQVQPGSGAFTWSSLTYAIHGELQPERRSISISRLQGYGMREEAVLRLYRFAIQEEWRCRYVFGYSLDDSDKPVYLIWPERTRNNGLWLLDVARNQYHNLCQTASICNLGLEHFYAAFRLGCSRDLRTSSARAFGVSVNDISEDCSVPSGCKETKTSDTWHSSWNSHSEKGQDWPASNRSATIGRGKRGKQSELLWLWGLV